MDPRRQLRSLLVAVPMVLLTAACGSAADQQATQSTTPALPADDIVVASDADPVYGGNLIYALTAETNSWDPGAGQWAVSGQTVARTLFDTLTTWNAEGEAVPFLAESVEPTDDELTEWTITVRSGVTFHDGTVLDAEVVKANIDHLRESPTVGAALSVVSAVDVVGERSVRLTTTQPFGILREALTGQAGTIASPAMFESPEGGRFPVGTGPFKLRQWEPGRRLIVDRNPDYWRDGLPYLDEIEFQITPDSQTRASSIATGSVDMLEAQEAGLVNRLLDNARTGTYQVITNTDGEGSKGLLIFNTVKPPFDDLNVRRAITMGLDTEALSIGASKGLNPPARSMLSTGSPYFSDAEYPDFDPEAASALVEAYEAANGPISFALNTPPDPEITATAQAIQSQLADIGVDVRVNGLDQTSLIVAAVAGSYDTTLFRLFGSPVPDAQYIFISPTTIRPVGEISLNVARLDDEATGTAIDDLFAAADPDAKLQAYIDMQDAVAASLPFAYLTQITSAIAAENSVRGFDAWRLPDGSPGLAQVEAVPMLAQVWLDR